MYYWCKPTKEVPLCSVLYSYPVRACAARGKVIEFVFLYLPVPATVLTRSQSLGFLLFSYYPVHLVSHFIYGHQSRPQIICHVFTYIHAHAQQLTLHSGCGVCSVW